LGDNIILCQEALGRVWVDSAVQVFVVSLPDDKMEKGTTADAACTTC
jgi:hypothetical protein